MNLYIEYPPTDKSSWVSVDNEDTLEIVMNILRMLVPQDIYTTGLELIGTYLLAARDIDNFIPIVKSSGIDIVEIVVSDKYPGWQDTIRDMGYPLFTGK